jgi:hypothetical protein
MRKSDHEQGRREDLLTFLFPPELLPNLLTSFSLVTAFRSIYRQRHIAGVGVEEGICVYNDTRRITLFGRCIKWGGCRNCYRE